MVTVTRKPKTRVIKRKKQRESLLRRIFSPGKLAVLGILTLIFFSVFAYFYFKYSRMIDARLNGDVLVRTTGIFAAPRSISTKQDLALASLKDYLDRIGYVESSKQADQKRGRYEIKGNSIEIDTSDNAIINSARQFPNITVTFGSKGKGITKIIDNSTGRSLDSAMIEPEMLTSLSGERRQKLVSYKDLPKDYINAVLAIEDRQFFEHSGINFRGIFRAVWRDVEEGELQQGGSSITQQLVKNFFLTPERTWERKTQEMMMAVVLENKLSKEEIFQLYCNEIYMGQAGNFSINGVGEAASAYFKKDVVNLTLPESAFLAGIIRGPSLYSPYRDPERAKARRNQVLDSMAETGTITREVAEQAKATDLKIAPKNSSINSTAPYFVDYLQKQIPAALASEDIARQSYRIYTTIDMDLQRAADLAVNDTLAQLDKIYAKRKKNPIPPGTLQAALVALNSKTGEILAMVGGRDYGKSQLNRATEANRQPGSVFKPIVYATALNTAYDEGSREDLITPASLFLDEPETFLYGAGQTYAPENYGKKYSHREVTLREGLVHSLNVVTVRIAEKVGYSKVARMAEKLGLPRTRSFPALALGTAEATPLEMASAYTAFANGGKLAEPVPIKRLTNSDGVSINEPASATKTALKPEISWLMTNIMQDVMNRGTAAGARRMGFTATAAGKTGTSRDGWFAGYTPNLVCVVYVGFDDNSELGLEGSKSALPIWTAFMKQALALKPDLGGSAFPKPDGVVSVEIDPFTGKLATEACPDRKTEYFIEGTEPEEECAEGEEDPLEPPASDQPDQPATRPRRATGEEDKPAREGDKPLRPPNRKPDRERRRP
ncbi:MAG: PBP1A family penicillin-binding protein [Blastocatellia bacterium]|nr:PBP1A family penicillin-binding protein [Blastocatellia bacterium]